MSTDENNALRVLVADDNTINLRLAARVLKALGHSGALVTDGDKALKALEAQRFDLLLLDATMPNRDGLSTLAEIRRLESLGRPHLPVIIVTAHDMPSDRKLYLGAGADGYIAKPLEAGALLLELSRVLGR